MASRQGVTLRCGDMRHIDGNHGTGYGPDGNRGRMTTALGDVATTRSSLDGTLRGWTEHHEDGHDEEESWGT